MDFGVWPDNPLGSTLRAALVSRDIHSDVGAANQADEQVDVMGHP